MGVRLKEEVLGVWGKRDLPLVSHPTSPPQSAPAELPGLGCEPSGGLASLREVFSSVTLYPYNYIGISRFCYKPLEYLRLDPI